MELSLFKGFTDTLPASITLDALVEMMRTDASVRDFTEKHRYYRGMGDTASAKYYKDRMPCFGVAARFAGGKRKEHIVALTGLSLVDIDHIAPDQMAAMLEKVRGDEHTLLAYTTMSGEGVRILSKYAFNDNVNVNADAGGASVATTEPLGSPRSTTLSSCFHPEGDSRRLNDNENENQLGRQTLPLRSSSTSSFYKTAFLQINEYYKNLTGLDTDLQCKNVGRLSTIAHDAELYYNPEAVSFVIKEEAKRPVGRPKKGKSEELRVKSYKVGEVESSVLRELKRRGVVYAPGSHNKYISDACYEMNRYGVPEEQCREWAVRRFADYDTPNVEAIVRSCYQQTAEHGTAQPPRTNIPYATIEQIRHYLIEQGIRMRHNVVTRKEEIFNDDEDPLRTKHYTLNTKLENSHADCTDYTEDSCLAGNVNQQNLDSITQNLQVASPLLASGAHTHPEGNTKHSTLNAKQELSHTDCTDYTENASLAGNINLTQTSRNSQNNISEQDNQRDLNEIAQNTHCFARVGHPEGDGAAELQAVGHWPLAVRQQTTDDRQRTPSGVIANSQAPSANSQKPIAKSLRANKGWAELTDHQLNSLHCRFCIDTGLRLHGSDLCIVIGSDLYPNYNPFADYLQQLPPWDGTTDHIALLASRVQVAGGAQALHDRCLRKWLVAMLATWLYDDVVNHEILTYIGRQGIYKSSFMRELLPPELRRYFSTRNFAQRMDKDARFELSEVGLVCLEELDHMKTAEVNQLKAIVTETHINERASYGRYKERRAHIASFCGTGNNPRFLSDPTGNRRWMPFVVERIVSPYTHPFDYTGIYSQAYALLQQGFVYWFTEEDNVELDRHNLHFEEPSPEEELILIYLAKPYGDYTGEFLTATRIIELVGGSIKQALSPRRIAFAMNKLGFEPRRAGNLRGWVAVILTGDQIKADQRSNAVNSDVVAGYG